MMIYYKNKQGEMENTITSENFSDFKNFIKETSEQNKINSQPQDNISVLKIADDVNLENFFDKDMTPENKECMESFLSRSLSNYCSQANREQLLNMSDSNPQFVYRVFQYAGNRRGGTYDFLMDGLRDRPVLKNLRLHDYSVRQDYNIFWQLEGKKEPVSHLTRAQIDILSRWAKFITPSNTFTYAYDRTLLESGILLNCDNLPSAWRKEVNKEALANHKEETAWWNLESRYMDKDFLKELLKNKKIDRYNPLQPSKEAKTQKQKNVGFYPQFYKNLQEALIRATQEMPKYDSSNYGKELTLNQRYQNLLKEIKGTSFDVEKSEGDILYEVYLQTAQKDIMEGRAQDLSKTTLENVLKKDINNYYIRKIPSKVLTEKKVNLDFRQQKYVNLQNLENIADYHLSDMAETSKKIFNRKEKEKMVQFLSDKIEKGEQQFESLSEILKEKKQDEQKLQQLIQENRSAQMCYELINKIQILYRQIKGNFKNGTPNQQEAEFLSEDKIENVIAQSLKGKRSYIGMPKQKSLPLLFGRKEEEKRRENLGFSISEMNRYLDQLTMVKNEDIQAYLGKILREETLSDAETVKDKKHNNFKTYSNEYYTKWNSNQVETDVKKTKEQIISYQQAKDIIIKRKQAIEKLSKENLFSTEEDKLENVSKLTGEEKHKARAANKTRGKDKLTEKEKAAKNGQDLKLMRAKQLQEIQR